MLTFLLEASATNWAPVFGGLGIALCVLMCGVGSAIGLRMTGVTAAAVLTEKPKKNGAVMMLSALPATQGLYGLLIGLLNYNKIGALTGTQGLEMLIACLPLAVVGMLSAIYQASTAVGGLKALAKSDLSVGRVMLYPVMVETYAILALVISIMMTGNVA